jgi:hypothetical protein
LNWKLEVSPLLLNMVALLLAVALLLPKGGKCVLDEITFSYDYSPPSMMISEVMIEPSVLSYNHQFREPIAEINKASADDEKDAVESGESAVAHPPSASPSASPSGVPSASPSAVPSSAPSSAPSAPAAAPTTAAPSPGPSLPPTAMPVTLHEAYADEIDEALKGVDEGVAEIAARYEVVDVLTMGTILSFCGAPCHSFDTDAATFVCMCHSHYHLLALR